MLYRILLLLAVLAPLQAAAQEEAALDAAEEEEEGLICLAIGRGWIGSHAELREIERNPVPESYRRQFEAEDSCASFQLIKESLVDWHLRFGSERSVGAALAYLERAYLREAPPPERYGAELERAWREAQRDLRRALQIQDPDGATYSSRHRFKEQSRTIQRLQALVSAAYGNYRFLAEQHLRAAEEHGSLVHLDKAELYRRAVQTGAEFLGRLQDRPPADGLIYFDLDTFRTNDVEMRSAVLRARLTRTSEAIARAEAVVQANDRPLYRQLAEHGFTGGSDLCDIDSGVGQGELIEAECEADEDTLHERVVSYLLARAMLDLVTDNETALSRDGNLLALMRLLEAERYFDQSRCCRALTTPEVLFRLQLVRAEFGLRNLHSARPDTIDHDSLDELRVTDDLATPYDAPTRFRRMARAWLVLFRESTAALGEEDQARESDLRYAAYLERTLSDLDAIAQVGGDD